MHHPGPRVAADGRHAPALRGVAGWLALAAGLAALTIVLQRRLGAYHSEFDWDESSHYISGLMIHDYLLAAWRSGHLAAPLAFLKRYHASYPLVGIGHWGPFYYVVEALWMLLFGWSRTSVLLLSSSVTLAAALLLYGLARRPVGGALAAILAAAFVASPIVELGSDALMLDVPIALLCLLASFAYGRYLQAHRVRHALAFALLAAAALLIKGNAACLALLPPFAVLIGRDWSLLRRGSFWLPLPVVAVLAGPWLLGSFGLVAEGFRYHFGWDYSSVAVPANAAILLGGVGPALLLLGAAGLALVLVRATPAPWSGQDSMMCAMAAGLLAVVVFQCVAPAAIQGRYLAPAVAPLLLLAGYALRRGLARLSTRPPHPALTAGLGGLLALTVLPWVRALPAKPQLGMIAAARQVWVHRPPANPVVLIAADGMEEAAAIAELAMRDPHRPSLFALRGSRLLGAGGYNTAQYAPRFADSKDVMAAISAYAIPLVLLRDDPAGNAWAHVGEVAALARAPNSSWRSLWQARQHGVPVALFQLPANLARRADIAALVALAEPGGHPTALGVTAPAAGRIRR